jgi:hypothetical protein
VSSFAVNSILINSANYFNTWRLITVRKFGSNLQIFEGNANVLNSVTNASPVVYSSIDKDFIVGNSNGSNTGFKGRIQDVFYYNRALTPTDFAQLSCSATPPVNVTTLPYQNICPGTTVQLNGQSTNTINWYTTAVGGTSIQTGCCASLGAVNSSATYYMDATASNGCVSFARVPIAVTVNTAALPAPTNTTPIANQTVCSGNTTTLSASGTSISWYAGQSGGTALGTGNNFTTPAITGNTTYYAQDGSGSCASTRIAIPIAVVTAPPMPTTSQNTTGTGCVGYSMGLNVSGSGTITWFDVPTGGTSIGSGTFFSTPMFSPPTPPAQTYAVTYYAQANNACGASPRLAFLTNVIDTFPAPVNTTPTANLTICAGSSTTLSVSSTATNIEWTEVFTVVGTGLSITTPVLNTTTNFAVVPTGITCAQGLIITVTVVNTISPTPANTTSTAALSVCSGNSTTLTATGTGTLTWYDTPTGGTALGTGNSFNTGAITTNKTFYVENQAVNSCASARVAVAVTVNALPTAAISPSSVSICSGSSVVLTASGGSTYSWSNSLGSGAAKTVSPTATTTYTVTVTNAASCSATASRLVTVNAVPTAGISPATVTICSGAATTLTASGGTQYAWSNGNNNAVATVSPTTNTTYTVTVTNAANCSATASRFVTVNPSPTINSITATADTTCAGQITSLTANSPNTLINYLWSNGGQSPTINVSPASTTTYTVTITQVPSGCTATASKTITVKALPAASIASLDTICPGLATTLTASGGGTYAWSNGLGNGAVKTVSPTVNTAYTVTVTAANGCTVAASKTIATHAPVSAGITQDPNNTICPGIPILLSVNATNPPGSVYLWSTGTTGTTTNSITVTPPATTTYWVKVSSPKGCTDSVSRTVNVVTTNASISGPTSVCPGGSAVLTASGDPGTSFVWSNGLGSGTVKTVSPTQTTTYSVTATLTCSKVLTYTVSIQSAPTASISGASSVCAGSSVTLTANGGNTYTWANGLGSNAAITVSPTQTTTYTVTASLGAGCTATATQTVTIKQATAGSIAQTICFGQSVLFNGISRAQSGSYRDTLVNVAGCDSFLTLNLTVRPQITGNISRTVCFGESFVFNGQTLTQNGNYRDTLTASNGCDSILTLNFTVRPRIASIQSQSICNGSSFVFNGQTITQAGQYFDTLTSVAGCDSFITLNVSLGQATAASQTQSACGSYTFNGQTLTQSGQYLDTLTSVGGCDSIVTLTLVVNDLPQPTITQNGNVLSTQTFDSYQWQLGGGDINNATAQNYTATANGNYTVLVIDSNGCSAFSPVLNVTGVGVNDVRQIDIRFAMYPNPTENILHIEVESNIPACRTGRENRLSQIQVIDMQGRVIITSKFEEKTTLNVSELAATTYQVKISNGGTTTVKRFVKL